MKKGIVFLTILLLIGLASCEQGPTLSPKLSRFIASEQLKDVDGKENLPQGVLEFLTGRSAKKFPLPYFLIPEDDLKMNFAENPDDRIADQLFMRITGKRHYKFFINPSEESAFDYLRSSYSYIDTDKTEFMAADYDQSKIIIWNRNNEARRPFLLELKSSDSVRILSTQKVFDRIGSKQLRKTGLACFPQVAGIYLEKYTPTKKISYEHIVSDFPDDYLLGERKWATLKDLAAASKDEILLQKIIRKSDLKTLEFVEKVFLNSYFRIMEEISLKRGLFISVDDNFALELAKDNGPTGFWVIRDYRNIHPDLPALLRDENSIDIFMVHENMKIFKFNRSQLQLKTGYTYFSEQLFGILLPKLAQYDQTVTPAQIASLKMKAQARFDQLLSQYTEVPLSGKLFKSDVTDSENLSIYLETKKANAEWMEISSLKGHTKFYLTELGLLETVGKKVVAVSLFNEDEKSDYKDNKKMLSIFKAEPIPLSNNICTRALHFFTQNKK